MVKKLENQIEAMKEEVEAAVEPTRRAGPSGPLKVGEKIRLRSIGMEGVIASLGEDDAEVQVGNLRVRARLSDIQRKGEQPAPQATPVTSIKTTRRAKAVEAVRSAPVFRESPGMELDIRGQLVEDALPAVERHLESAYLAGLPFVRIIHGKGTGRLRQAVREALRESPHVTSYESGQEREGGDGVTVAHLATD
jgi:DNA mismatch repair protein MutS2